VIQVPEIFTIERLLMRRVRGHTADFTYALNRQCWVHGYATEAAWTVTAWAMSVFLESTGYGPRATRRTLPLCAWSKRRAWC